MKNEPQRAISKNSKLPIFFFHDNVNWEKEQQKAEQRSMCHIAQTLPFSLFSVFLPPHRTPPLQLVLVFKMTGVQLSDLFGVSPLFFSL